MSLSAPLITGCAPATLQVVRLTQSSSGPAGRIASGVFLTLLGTFGLWFVIYDLGYVLILMLKMPFSGWILLYRVPVQTLYIAVGLWMSVWAIVYPWRNGARLDGTVLTVRGLLRTRKVDLAVARVRGVTEAGGRDDVPVLSLVAADPATGREVRLRVGDGQGLLPEAQLSALADAIAVGGTEDDGRRLVVERLRYFIGLRFPMPPRFLWEDPPPLRTRPRHPDRTTGPEASD
jgi:hypothetical protein